MLKRSGETIKKGICKKMEFEIEGYSHYIYNQKKEIIVLFGKDKPILRLKQIISVKKDDFGNLPGPLKEKEMITILSFQLPEKDSNHSIIRVLDSKNQQIWITPNNIKTH